MKHVLLFSITVFMFIACGNGDKIAELRELEAERNALDTRIETLRAEIEQEGLENPLQNVTPVSVEQVNPEMFAHYIEIQGLIESDHNIFIPAQSSGVVKRIHVTEGASVKAGDLLAELDGAILENTLAELKVNYELAQTVFERQKRLWDKNIGSEVQYLQAKTNKESLEKRIATVEEQYRLTKIISPIDGTVDEIILKEGEAVAVGFGTIRVVEMTKMTITARLSEEYIGKIKVGDSVKVNVPVTGAQFSSRIRSVSRVIDASSRTFPIEVTIPANVNKIKPNMTVVLTINDYRKQDALVVPLNVLQRSGEDRFIFVAVPGEDNESGNWKAERRTIRLSMNYQGDVEVEYGLNPGEYIVTNGFQDLADGQDIKVVQE